MLVNHRQTFEPWYRYIEKVEDLGRGHTWPYVSSQNGLTGTIHSTKYATRLIKSILQDSRIVSSKTDLGHKKATPPPGVESLTEHLSVSYKKIIRCLVSEKDTLEHTNLWFKLQLTEQQVKIWLLSIGEKHRGESGDLCISRRSPNDAHKTKACNI